MSLPSHLPSTQSFFYMKLITYAYYRITSLDGSMPLLIIQEFKILEQLSLITPNILEFMITSLILYFQKDNNLSVLESYYQQDCKATADRIGHIAAQYQEKILEETILEIDEESYKQSPLFNFYNGRVINIKDAIDYYLLITYYLDFLQVETQ